MNYQSAIDIKGRNTAFQQGDQTAFFLFKQRKIAYLPRYWVVNDKSEYMDLINYLCQIDMIVHPEVIKFPQKYELINKSNSPELVPIMENL